MIAAPLFALHLSAEEIRAGIADVLASPADAGMLEMIVARPAVGKRTVLETAELTIEDGLKGDNWRRKGSWRPPRTGGDPERQLTIMNWRFALLIAGSRDRVPLAGDQLYADLDLGRENLAPGTRLSLGTAVVEVTRPPHTGCRKFTERFGIEAMRFTSGEFGRIHNLRGINARVISPGTITSGDRFNKLA